MGRKVKVAIFDNDLRVEEKEYELNPSGNKISIIKEGAGYFMPFIDNHSFLEFPSWKKYILFGPRTWKRLYIVKKKASRCVNFGTGIGQAYGPDEEQVKIAIGSTLLPKIGQPEQGIPWYIGAILIFSFLSFFMLLASSGVLR